MTLQSVGFTPIILLLIKQGIHDERRIHLLRHFNQISSGWIWHSLRLDSRNDYIFISVWDKARMELAQAVHDWGMLFVSH